MAAPTFMDGVRRGFIVVGLPSTLILLLVMFVRHSYGLHEAGIVYLGGTVVVLLSIITAAKFWNVAYTMGYFIGGLSAWIFIPGVTSQLVPQPYTFLGGGFVLISLLAVLWMAPQKL